ncbi:Ribosome maturation factor [Melia azedarach]|uniref:Ribosome maturation factor n=2 Tax=Melia azedarach TaxID=155640 RepID=A0ACC1YY91_MELAZ|nr:Ribosome maturation factor [Melia azedarach]KAJ4728604.1 Ribosome maturation factor [Melia azedarach]
MQRQSLGSPVSKPHLHGGLPKEDSRLTEQQPSSSSVTDYDDDDNKTAKPRRLSLSPPPSLSTHSRPEKLIHLIPLLTLFCFLVLYLSSHSPSQSDLAQFSGFKRPSNYIDSSSSEIEDVSRFIELRRGDFLAIRSLRNLQEIEKHAPKSRPHRKIADF